MESDLPELEPARPRTLRAAALVVAFGLVGALEILAGYWVLRPQLPAVIPVHFTANGTADSFGSPVGFVTDGLLVLLGITLLFLALIAATGGEPTLPIGRGDAEMSPLLWVNGVFAMVTLPAALDLSLLADAGHLPSGPLSGQLPLVVGVAPLLAVGGWIAYLAIAADQPGTDL